MAASKILASIGGSLALGISFGMPSLACTPPPVNCGMVAFAPQSDWLAANIMATNTACSTARALATLGKNGPARFSAYAFNCRGRDVPAQGLAYKAYTCRGPSGRLVTWNLY